MSSSLLRPLVMLAIVASAARCGNDTGGLDIDPVPDGGTRDGAAGSQFDAAAGAGGSGGGGAGGAAGSGGGGQDSGSPAGGLTYEKACAESTVFCERIEACAPYLLKLVWGDVRACADRVRISCIDDSMAPGVTATPAQYVACMKLVKEARCEDLFNNRLSCNFNGTLANGSACGAGAQCSSGYCRKRADGCGVCASKSNSGAACQENDDCQTGLICNSMVCAAPQELGAACGPGRPCRAPLFCKAAVCAEAGVAGDPCTTEDSCRIWSGFLCNTNAKVCQKYDIKGGGDACGFAITPPTFCGGSGECRPNVVSGVCQAPAGDGESCGPAANNRTCFPPARCLGGVCKLPSAASCR